MIFSCSRCSKTIIKDDKGKVLVGCEHYPTGEVGDIMSFLQGFSK